MPPEITSVTPAAQPIQTVHLRTPSGLTASILTLGARLIDLRLPDTRTPILSYQTLRQIQADAAYVAVAVGRVTNRIREARVLAYPEVDCVAALQSNDGAHHIHGGVRGFDTRVFDVVQKAHAFVVLQLVSNHADQGYPSAVKVRVRYELRGEGDLSCQFVTENLGPHPTIANMTVRFLSFLHVSQHKHCNC